MRKDAQRRSKCENGMAGCRGELIEGRGEESYAQILLPDETGSKTALGMGSAMDKYSRYQREVSTEHLLLEGILSSASYKCPQKTKLLLKNEVIGQDI